MPRRHSFDIACRYLVVIVTLCSPTFTFGNNDGYWFGGEDVAISLSYDDALNSHLDNAIPALKKYNFRASFYLTLSSPTVNDRMSEWKQLSAHGHELGNHSIHHPCRSSLANREWVKPNADLDTITAIEMANEVLAANRLLTKIDGKKNRTYTPPCGDVLASGENYLKLVDKNFIAIKGKENNLASVLLVPSDMNGGELISFVKENTKEGILINLIFHGIGGDYLSVSTEAHEQLLAFLNQNRSIYWVDNYVNIMTFHALQSSKSN